MRWIGGIIYQYAPDDLDAALFEDLIAALLCGAALVVGWVVNLNNA